MTFESFRRIHAVAVAIVGIMAPIAAAIVAVGGVTDREQKTFCAVLVLSLAGTTFTGSCVALSGRNR